MDTNFELVLRQAKRALRNIEALKTTSCLGIEIIGFYIDGKLSKGEERKVELHISSCLYCLHQLLELKELIYFQREKTSLPSHLLNKISDLYPKSEKLIRESLENTLSGFIREMFNLLILPFRQWRYATVSVVTTLVVIFIIFTLLIPERGIMMVPRINPDSFVRVQALNSEGSILSEAKGVIVDSKGVVATLLHPIVGANLTRIILRDGRTYQTQSLWKDEGKNLALMKIEGGPLSAFPIADLKQLYIGQRVLIVTDPSQVRRKIEQAIISDFKGQPGRTAEGEIQYIQLASFTTQYSRGALIDQKGNLIGLLISEEKGINLAVPLSGVSNLIESKKPISISELKSVSFNQEALNYYFKGILARDAYRDDEAMEFFKKAIELNPNLEGPRLELGGIYYNKRLYDMEISEYQEVLKINPENIDALFYLAQAYETKGLYDLAIKEYEKIISIDPKDAETYYHLGLAYLAQGEKDKALKLYHKLRRLDPGFAEKLRRLAVGCS